MVYPFVGPLITLSWCVERHSYPQGVLPRGFPPWCCHRRPHLEYPGEGFKFMVNLKWINHHAVNGIDHAPAAIKKLHDKFNGMKSPPPKKLSLAVNDLKT